MGVVLVLDIAGGAVGYTQQPHLLLGLEHLPLVVDVGSGHVAAVRLHDAAPVQELKQPEQTTS